MNNLKNSIFYLCGPIDDYVGRLGNPVDWREDITEFLHSLNAGVFNPLNKAIATIDEGEGFVEYINSLKKMEHYDEASRLMKEIVRSDYAMLDRCTANIVHINKDLHMCGSYFEIAQSCLRRTPNIIHCEQGKKAIPNWLWGICDNELFFSTWDEVKEYLVTVDQTKDIDGNSLNGKWKFVDYSKVFKNECFN